MGVKRYAFNITTAPRNKARNVQIAAHSRKTSWIFNEVYLRRDRLSGLTLFYVDLIRGQIEEEFWAGKRDKE